MAGGAKGPNAGKDGIGTQPNPTHACSSGRRASTVPLNVRVSCGQEWMDERLSWVPELHNNMTEIIVEARKLWKPELAVINGSVASIS